MKYIKILGLKRFLLFMFLRTLEVILNLPYKLLSILIHVLYNIIDWFDDWFYYDNIIYLRKIKIIDRFWLKCFNLIKESEDK